ncbi:MAG TPA: hypothetical protein VIT91_03915 [Chthoniobacterales bacterium]
MSANARTISPVLRLGQLLLITGGIQGRKKLQKIVHLLQAVGKVPFGYGFQFSFYGPYSVDLKAEMDELADEKLVIQEPFQTQFGSPIYHFQLGPAMKRLLEDLKVSDEEEWTDLARQLNLKTAIELEGISTVVFLQNVGWSGNELEEQFRTLKPKLEGDFEKYRAAALELNDQTLGHGAASYTVQ